MSRGTAVQANVGQALAQRRLAEAQRALRALGEEQYPVYEEGVDTGENIASDPPAAEAPACGSDEAQAAPDFSTTVENLDQEAPAGDYGQREQVTSATRREADGNMAEAQPDVRQNVEAPVANMVDPAATEEQYSESGWDNNADNQPQGGGDSSSTSTVVPDGSGSAPMQARSAVRNEAMVRLEKASASQVYQLADLYDELGLIPREKRYAAIAEMEKAPAMLVADRIRTLRHVASVLGDQLASQGRVTRTAGSFPVLGRTASARTPSMARQAENRRLASNAEDTLLFVH